MEPQKPKPKEGIRDTVLEWIEEGSIRDILRKWINPRFILAEPLRVDFFQHDLETKSNSNRKAAEALEKEPYDTLHTTPEGDRLHLYKGGIVLITKDPLFPIKFYCAWKTILFMGKSAIQTEQLWCDPSYRKMRIMDLPLGAYCLFKVLLPKFNIVVGADEHTPEGERHAKHQVKYALENNIFIYAKDEHNQLFNISTHELVEKDADVFWGSKPEYKQRLLIYSRKDLFP